ncbi:MAG: nucleoside hydrolase [Bulleidia sp.]
MKRMELLNTMHLRLPIHKQLRVIVDSDVANEADDPFAIVHFLLTPMFDVRGMIASHHESKAIIPETTQPKNYKALKTLIDACQIDDIPIFNGCTGPMKTDDEILTSDGVDFIIQEALKEDDRPLFVCVLGTMTDVGAALLKCPEIAEKITVVFTGGNAYPTGGNEFNFSQDVHAVRALMAAKARVWQIPLTAYGAMEVTMAELAVRIRPYGTIGAYLYDQLEEFNYDSDEPYELRKGENWIVGDSPVIGVLLSNGWRNSFHTEYAPYVNDDLTYSKLTNAKQIRVYDSIDPRMILEDLYAKIQLVSE